MTGRAIGIKDRAVIHHHYTAVRHVTCPYPETGNQDCCVFFSETFALLPRYPPTKH
jgi:hypothetical protein